MIFAVIFICIGVAVNVDAASSLNCPPHDGVLPVYIPDKNCSRFWECSNGLPYLFECPDELQFSPALNICVSPEAASCSGEDENDSGERCPLENPDCPALDGEHPVYIPLSKCNHFCQCSNGDAYLHRCPKGLHFNSKLNVCDWPENVGCTNDEGNENTTQGPDSNEDGDSIATENPGVNEDDDSSNSDGSDSNEDDSTDTENPGSDGNDDSGNSDSEGSESNENDSGSDDSDKGERCPLENPNCPDKCGDTPVYIPLPNCTQFCQCSNGDAYLHNCPHGLHFNPTLNVCDYPQYAGCATEDSGSTTQGPGSNEDDDSDNSEGSDSNENDNNGDDNEDEDSNDSDGSDSNATTTENPGNDENDDSGNSDGSDSNEDDSTATEKPESNEENDSGNSDGSDSNEDSNSITTENPGSNEDDSTATEKPGSNEDDDSGNSDGSDSNEDDSIVTDNPENDENDDSGNSDGSDSNEDDSTATEKPESNEENDSDNSDGSDSNEDSNSITTENPESNEDDSTATEKPGSNEDDNSGNDENDNSDDDNDNRERCPLENPNCPAIDGKHPVYIPLPNCTQFCQCSNGDAYLHDCPDGLHFNPKLNVCDYPEDAGCANNDGSVTQGPDSGEDNDSIPTEKPESNEDDDSGNSDGSDSNEDDSTVTENPGSDGNDDSGNSDGSDSNEDDSTVTENPGNDGNDDSGNSDGSDNNEDDSTVTENPGSDGNDDSGNSDGSGSNEDDSTVTENPGSDENDDSGNSDGSDSNEDDSIVTENPGGNGDDDSGNSDGSDSNEEDEDNNENDDSTNNTPESIEEDNDHGDDCPLENPGCPAIDGEHPTYIPLPNCTQFCQCSNGKAYLHNCPDGLHFNPTLNVCDWPVNAGCAANEAACPLENPGCPAIDGEHPVYIPLPKCGQFCQCSNGDAYLHNCPHGLHFNPILNVCDWPHNAHCTGSDGVGNGTDIIEDTRLGSLLRCPLENAVCPVIDGDNPVYIPLSSSCSQFCVCRNGAAYLYHCPAGYHFNRVSHVCDWPETAQCEY